ncbi:MAG TPA: hypothetical protein VII90_09245, partial [Anaerolineales bacterium]
IFRKFLREISPGEGEYGSLWRSECFILTMFPFALHRWLIRPGCLAKNNFAHGPEQFAALIIAPLPRQ